MEPMEVELSSPGTTDGFNHFHQQQENGGGAAGGRQTLLQQSRYQKLSQQQQQQQQTVGTDQQHEQQQRNNNYYQNGTGGGGYRRQHYHTCDQLVLLIKAYMEYYPKITACLGLAVAIPVMYGLVWFMKTPITRNRLSHDYTAIDLDYNFKASQIDHWCLFGGDDDCTCDDFSEAMPREEVHNWLSTHKANVGRIQMNRATITEPYDVVFVGGDEIEAWSGTQLGKPIVGGNKNQQLFARHFLKSANGQFNGIPLGIAEDGAANVLWRLQHDELPTDLDAQVWWVSVGGNDLRRGGCSEEAVVLGVLRVVEEIYHFQPNARIVVQALLPQSQRPDGALEPKSPSLFGFHHKAAKVRNDPDEARKRALLWPSIQHINQELAEFCTKHPHLIFFDASALFVGSLGNQHFRQAVTEIIPSLMPDYQHLSFDGMQVLAEAIDAELQRILYYADEANDVVGGSGGSEGSGGDYDPESYPEPDPYTDDVFRQVV